MQSPEDYWQELREEINFAPYIANFIKQRNILMCYNSEMSLFIRQQAQFSDIWVIYSYTANLQ